jgi:putative OPT family oligopeptide transporter
MRSWLRNKVVHGHIGALFPKGAAVSEHGHDPINPDGANALNPSRHHPGRAADGVFTAANVYLGLKIGLTFATSIPAAVISMAVLRYFKGATIQENNIVQTIASAAGTLSAIIFVLPGLIMIGWWVDFPYWQSVAVIGVGGILGVMYSVPLRRALVTGSDLPYPEGVAAAEVLKVGAGVGGEEENRKGLAAIVRVRACRSVTHCWPSWACGRGSRARFPFRRRCFGRFDQLSALRLIGVGHLVGLTVGLAMLIGMLISWVVLVPHYTAGGVPARMNWPVSFRACSRARCASSARAPSAWRRSGRCCA